VTEIAQYCGVWVLTECDDRQSGRAAYLQEYRPTNLEFMCVRRKRWEVVIGRKTFLNYALYRRRLRRATRFPQQPRSHEQAFGATLAGVALLVR
jgi:hypothetical protein